MAKATKGLVEDPTFRLYDNPGPVAVHVGKVVIGGDGEEFGDQSM